MYIGSHLQQATICSAKQQTVVHPFLTKSLLLCSLRAMVPEFARCSGLLVVCVADVILQISFMIIPACIHSNSANVSILG